MVTYPNSEAKLYTDVYTKMLILQAVQTSSISLCKLTCLLSRLFGVIDIHYYIDGTVIILWYKWQVKCTPSLTIGIIFTIGIVALQLS